MGLNVRTTEGIFVEKKKGTVEFRNNNTEVVLVHGAVLVDAGQVDVHNKTTNKYLTFGVWERDLTGQETKVDNRKVDPGKAVRITGKGGWEGATGRFYPDVILKDFDLRDTDPNPSDPGGKSPTERSISEFQNWIEKNWWVIILVAVLGIVSMFLFYLVIKESRKAGITETISTEE